MASPILVKVPEIVSKSISEKFVCHNTETMIFTAHPAYR